MQITFFDFEFNGQHFNSYTVDIPDDRALEKVSWERIRDVTLERLQEDQSESQEQQLKRLCRLFSESDMEGDTLYALLKNAKITTVTELYRASAEELRAIIPEKTEVLLRMVGYVESSRAQASSLIAEGWSDRNIWQVTDLPCDEIGKLRRERESWMKRRAGIRMRDIGFCDWDTQLFYQDCCYCGRDDGPLVFDFFCHRGIHTIDQLLSIEKDSSVFRFDPKWTEAVWAVTGYERAFQEIVFDFFAQGLSDEAILEKVREKRPRELKDIQKMREKYEKEKAAADAKEKKEDSKVCFF